MYFANPWGLLGLLSLPAIVFIHLFHRRFPPLQIAGLHLWGVETRKDSPGRKRERLPFTRSLFLELLAALLISLLIADPRNGASETRNHLVLVLDNSASMSAVDSSSRESSRDRALTWIKQQEKRLGRGGLVSVLLTGKRPTLIAGPRSSWDEMLLAVENWQPLETQHAFESAWDLGNQLAGDESEYLFLTDYLPEEPQHVPQRMEIRAFGKPLNNIAITAARWVYDPVVGDGTLFIRVANLGLAPKTVEITATSQNRSLIQEKHELAAGVEKSLEWILPGGLGQIDLVASADGDPLTLDHTIKLVEPAVRQVTACVTLPSNHPAFEYVRRILAVMPQVQLGDPDQADLIIAPAADSPQSQRGLWWLGLGPIALAEADRSLQKTVVGPYLIEKQNPLVEGVVLGGVVWGGVQDAPTGLLPVISTGNSLLLGQWNNSASNAFLMNIDLQSSNLSESPDWPIFWTNLIEQCRNSLPGFRRWNYHLEESIIFTLPPEALESNQELKLIHNQSSRPLIRTETIEISPRDTTGIYEVRDGENRLGLFAVNFLDRMESNLLLLNSGQRPAAEQAVATGIQWDNPISWLLVLGIFLVLIAIYINWYFLRRVR